MEAPSVILACTQCQRRKVRCDKKTPCNQCLAAQISCVAVRRPRKPRGRQGTGVVKSVELKERVVRLEALVKNLQTSKTASEKTSGKSSLQHARTRCDSQPSHAEVAAHENTANSPSIIGNSFWMALKEEVVGLREILDGSSDDEGEAEKIACASTVTDITADTDASALLFSSKPQKLDLPLSPLLSQEVTLKLFDIYQERVDLIFKIGHWPSMYELLTKESMDPDYNSARALQVAVSFTALCTITDGECSQYLGFEKYPILQTIRQQTEQQLAAAGLLNTTSVVLLQAFVVYLVGLRTCESSRASWALVALAARIAAALGLNGKEIPNLNWREIEVRKRLWHSIGLLDIQTALDRGSTPLLSVDDFPNRPFTVSEHELSNKRDSPTQKGTHLTDKTFCSMTFEAMNLCRRIYQPSKTPSLEQVDFHEKLDCLQRFKTNFQAQHLPPGSQELIAVFTKLVADGITVTMELLIRRPLYKTYFKAPDRFDNFDVFSVATEVLERGELKVAYTAFQRWQWFSWLKWFALAVVLAELCGRAFTPDVDRAWNIVDTCFERYSREVADSAGGLLWKPIQKLYNRAMKKREGGMNQTVHQHLSAEISSRNADGRMASHNTGHELFISPQGPTQYGGLEHLHAHDIFHSEFLEHGQPEADLEEEALSWINWELFLDDMNESAPLFDGMATS